MSLPIEDYAMIGDGQTVALVNRDGGIDWLCWPRFDSDACFSALLGDSEHGRWSITPADTVIRRERRYQTDTLVMETDLHTEQGGIRLIDFMPIRDGASTVVRVVVGLGGTVHMRMDLNLRFSYGTMIPWIKKTREGVDARIGPDMVTLHAPVDITLQQQKVTAGFTVQTGQRLAFVLRYTHADQPGSPAVDPEAALESTQHFWREWIGRFDNSLTRWPDAARRSLITLKALVHQPSGGLVAAPTTSLPEIAGGKMNWDYRYCWLRDASFTVSAFVRAGYLDEATRWRDWVLRAVGGTPETMQIMYRVDGARHLDEREIDELPGWNHARPVLVGNLAAQQHQVDVYGELLYAFDLGRRAGMPADAQERLVCLKTAEHIERIWKTPGSGVWEDRGELRHYTYSQALAWIGLDRFLSQNDCSDRALIERLTTVRDNIKKELLLQGWNDGLGHFTQYYGGHDLDASLLLMPLVGFISANDPKMAATIDAVRHQLNEEGLIRRMRRKLEGPDEGAFLACSCWMADCLDLQGRHEEAIAQFERVLALRNDLGLLSEEYDVLGKNLTGNFPQALTHLAVVNTALGLSSPMPVSGGG